MKEWLKDLRESKGYTQESLAHEVGIPKTTYSSYEQGHRRPSIVNAKKLSEVLDVSWTLFFEDGVLETYDNNRKEVAK
jgi:transcriptional regulator with XRE-family HTH domain